jgi:hypothetical protein
VWVLCCIVERERVLCADPEHIPCPGSPVPVVLRSFDIGVECAIVCVLPVSEAHSGGIARFINVASTKFRMVSNGYWLSCVAWIQASMSVMIEAR